MSEFVAHTAAAGVTPTIARHSYAKLGKSHAFEAQPAVLHFGGYKLNKVHTQKLRLVNRSDRSQRVHIIVPTTPYFKAKYDKKGLVAPGMAEEVTIEFMPTEWRCAPACRGFHACAPAAAILCAAPCSPCHRLGCACLVLSLCVLPSPRCSMAQVLLRLREAAQ